MQKIPRKPRLRGVPRIAFAAALTALTLWTVGVAATAHSLSDAAERLRQETALPLALLRYEMGGEEADELSLGALLALSLTPILADARSEVTQAWSSELQLPPDETKPDTEDHEGTTLSDAQTGETVPRGADNGVPSRTLRVGDPSGYTVLGNVCINNGSKCTLDASQLTGAPAAAECPADGPQVLIVHTHGTEAYTMPAGEEYEASDDHRTLEKEKNMIRVGDEIARVLTDAGLGVLHDRELYDYPNYSGAYNRSLAAIEKYRAEYPSLLYILDVHRDAVADSEGNNYKLLCAEEPGPLSWNLSSARPAAGWSIPTGARTSSSPAPCRRRCTQNTPRSCVPSRCATRATTNRSRPALCSSRSARRATRSTRRLPPRGSSPRALPKPCWHRKEEVPFPGPLRLSFAYS